MKDIDFDELDKAVNSLMGSVEAPADPPKQDAPVAESAPPEPAPVAPTPSVEAPTPAPAPDVKQAEEAPQGSPAPRPSAAAPAQRRGGRFMDMVHTSSDMKAARPSQAPSREGLTVAPRSEAASTAPIADVAPATPQPESDTTTPAWPDPLDLATDTKSSGEAPAAEPTAEPVAATPVETPAPAGVEEPVLESPFLADAKVEKRPLNAGTPSVVDMPATSEETPEASTADTDQPATTPADSEETPRPFVPAELNSDLVAIESGEPKEDAQSESAKQPAASESEPKQPTGPTSIAQQYREEPSSGDQSHAAIYDASQFPAPLSHPAKKKSGWLWVVWVVLLLALGAGGAVALYMADII